MLCQNHGILAGVDNGMKKFSLTGKDPIDHSRTTQDPFPHPILLNYGLFPTKCVETHIPKHFPGVPAPSRDGLGGAAEAPRSWRG